MTELNVRAVPAPGNARRWRAGIPWTKTARRVRVVDAPAKPAKLDLAKFDELEVIEISPQQYAALLDDPRIVAVPVGGDDPLVPTLQGELAASQEEIAHLRRKLSAATEAWEEERRSTGKTVEEVGLKLQAAEAEAERLRGLLAKRK